MVAGAFFAFSIGPIKWVVVSEIFPTNLRARAMGVALPAELTVSDAQLTPELVVPFLRDVAVHFFPRLGGNAS